MKSYQLCLVMTLLVMTVFSACVGDSDNIISESMSPKSSIAEPGQVAEQSEVPESIPNKTSSQDTTGESIESLSDFSDRLPQEQTLELLRANNVPPGYLYLEGYDYISCPSEGMVWAKKDGKVGFLNAVDLSEAIPCIYDSANDFSGGYSPACLGGKYGYIDKNNNVVIAFEYVYADPVKNGIAIATTFSRDVYESLNTGLNPSYSLLSYAVLNIENGAILHESSQIIKYDQKNLFSPMQKLNMTGKYPVVAETSTVSVDINGYYAIHDGSAVYQNEPIYQAVEWSNEISFDLLDPPRQ